MSLPRDKSCVSHRGVPPPGQTDKVSVGAVLRENSSKAVGRLFCSESEIVVYIGAVGTENAVDVDRDLVAELLDHLAKRSIVLEVFVATVQPHVVLLLQQGPASFLRIKRRGIPRLEGRVEPAELFSHLVAVMSWSIIHDKVRPRGIGVAKLLGQSDEEDLYAGNVCAGKLHVELATNERFANGPVQSHRAQVVLVLRGSYWRVGRHPSLRGLAPHLERGLIHENDVIALL